MARIGLKSKLRRLEKCQQKRLVNRVALEYACDATGTPTDPEMAAWLSTSPPKPENAPKVILEAYAGILNSKIILCPCFGDDATWEAVTSSQQNQLLAVARSRL